MQKYKKQIKQLKSVSNPIPQAYISSVSNIFLHPSQLLYIVVSLDTTIRIFDVPTMSLIGKTYTQVSDAFKPFKCMFDEADVGLFYILFRKQNEARGEIGAEQKIRNLSQQDQGIRMEEQNEQGQQINNWLESESRYEYRLIMYEMGKGEISSNTCEINLNNNEECRKEIAKKIHEQQISEKMNKMANPTPNYRSMEQQRQSFIQEYYHQAHGSPNTARMLEDNDKGIGEGQEGDCNGQNQVMEDQMRDEKGGNMKQKESSASRYRMPVQIVDISTYARKAKNTNEATYTILSTHSFWHCSLANKIDQYPLYTHQNQHILVGFDIFGNTDMPQATDSDQIEDIWLVFDNEQVCLLKLVHSHTPSVQPLQQMRMLAQQKITSFGMLPIGLHPQYYKQAARQLQRNNNKKQCMLITNQNEICLISYKGYELNLIWKVKLQALLTNLNLNITTHQSDIAQEEGNGLGQAYEQGPRYRKYTNLCDVVNFMSIVNFGVNTSTTNKYENKIVVMIAICNSNLNSEAEQKERQKQKEKQKQGLIYDDQKPNENQVQTQVQKPQQKPKQKQKSWKQTTNIYVYEIERISSQGQSQQVASSYSVPKFHSEHILTIIKQFPYLHSHPWYSDYLQNKLNYLCEGEAQMIDLCRVLDGKNIGKQWVNLGYRFEALQANEMYEELQDQFELTAQQNGIGADGLRNKIMELNDWTYCKLPRSVVLNKSVVRLPFLDF